MADDPMARAAPPDFSTRLSFVLMLKLLEDVRDSGANRIEAECALQAAAAMLPELKLPTTTVYAA